MRRSAGTIFWGITLIAIGGLLLARNLGYDIRVWGYIARYWPALLIVWGLLKLVDYYRFKKAGDTRPLFSGGEVALLVFVIFAGAAMTTAANISSDVGTMFEIGDVDLWDITGNNFTFNEHEEAVVPDGSTIEIVNLFGDVEVRPSDSDHVLLDVKKTIRAATKDEADRLSKDFTFSISNEGDQYRIASTRDAVPQSRSLPIRVLLPRQRYKSSMILQVPKRSLLRVNNRNGKVQVSDLGGNQDISNRFGEVDVRNVTGDVKVSNSFGRITLENVQGGATITGRNNAIDLQRIEGDVKVESSFQNVDIRDPKGSVEVSSQFGNVTIEVPANSSFRITARTEFGQIDSDFVGLETNKSNRETSMIGEVGHDGPQITISARHGTIHLVRRS
jgi:hypothetical protein